MIVEQINMRQAQSGEAERFDAWLRERHYRRCVPPGAVLRLEFSYAKEIIGAMMWGRPCARMLEPEADHILELTRMWFDDRCAFERSAMLARARARIRTMYPQVRLCLAYSDPEQGHEGTVYIADGWARFGKTSDKKSGWANRAGRHDACGHSKIRFVRTP